jgi:hypothetical protein
MFITDCHFLSECTKRKFKIFFFVEVFLSKEIVVTNPGKTYALNSNVCVVKIIIQK